MSTIKTYLDEADSYYSIVSRNINGSRKLGNTVMLNLSSIIVEKYLVTLLMAKSIPIQGHSVKSLLKQVKKHFDQVPVEITNLSEIDERMDLCSLNAINSSIPNNEEMNTIVANITFLKDYIYKTLGN